MYIWLAKFRIFVENAYNIEHEGVIFDKFGNRIDISLLPVAGCGDCKAKALCGMDGQDEKVVSVMVTDPSKFEVGEKVMVSVTRGMGIKAVVLAYIVPFFLLLGLLLFLLKVGAGEIVAGLSSLGAVAVYYVLLRIFRGRIDKEIAFKISKILG